jgi:hypothetical protein
MMMISWHPDSGRGKGGIVRKGDRLKGREQKTDEWVE